MATNSNIPAQEQAPASGHKRLKWKSQWGFQVATDSRCYYIRESGGSIIAAFIFSVAISVAAGWLGVSVFVSEAPTTLGEKGFGVLMFFIAAAFLAILFFSLKRGRWMVVFDRGDATSGTPGEVRYEGSKRLPVERIRSFSTRSCGGRPPRSTVVAELHDGTHASLGPVEIQSWAAHYAQQAATWMGLPFRPGT